MKKLLFSLGLVVTLLGATILSPTQAQSDFFAPIGQTHQVESKAGTFTDISGLSGTVLVNPLGANAALRGQVFGATEAGGTTPKATQITSGQATVNCFPIGFDFPFLGQKMKYFAISSGGGVFFSQTATRAVPCPFNPSGTASTFGVLTIPGCKSVTVTDNGKYLSWKKYGIEVTGTIVAENNDYFKAPVSKATACYRVDGAAGDRVLTVQHDYCIIRAKTCAQNLSSKPDLATAEKTTDEWIFQFKFYERDGSFEMVVKELQQSGNTGTSSASDYKLAIGLMGTNDAASSVLGSNYLNIQPNNGSSYGLSISSSSNNWQSFGLQTYGSTYGPYLNSAEKPEEGRTIRWWNARCASQPQPHPAVGEDAFIINLSYPSATSVKVQVQYDMKQFASEEDIYGAGTIVGVLSDSEEPDFTLQDGTLYLKGDVFPAQNGKAAPSVVFNKMHGLSGAYGEDLTTYPSGQKNNATDWVETTVEGLAKGAKRYIHLYRMAYLCGTPLYSPLCHTIEISNKFRSEKPDLLETVGLPTRNALGLKVKPHEGDDVLVVKTHDLKKVKEIPEEGPHAAGATIAEDLVVIGTYSEETTFQVTGLPDDDICYFVAVPVNKTTREYDNVHTINCRARVAHSGVPFDLDFRLEANGNPWLEKKWSSSVGKYVETYDQKIYRPLPVGWTRTDNLPAERHDLGLGLGKPNFDNFAAVAIYGQLEVQGTDADAISTPIYLNKGKIGVTYYMKFQARGNSGDGGVEETTPKSDDKCIIEYSIGEGNDWSAWTELKSYQGNAFPGKTTYNGAEYYPLEARLTVPNASLGKYLRFRFRMQTGSGHEAYPKCDYGCVYIMDVFESADCLTPTNLQQNQTNTTGTAIPLSWSDPNPAANKATAFEVSYRKAYTGEAWQTLSVNTANATVSGLTSSTPYAFRVTAVCPSDNSLVSDSAVFNTLYRYAYMETMIEDTGYFYYVFGSRAYARGLGPLERGVKSYTGTLPNSGNASLTATAEDQLFSSLETWTPKWGWERWILNRRCPQSMGVCQTAQNAWLVTPVIENNYPQQAQIVRFRATAGWSSSAILAPANWTKGSVNPSVYGRCTLQVLLSNNGKFTKDDVVGTLDISSYTDLINKTLEVVVPAEKAKTGHVQVALYFNNPDKQEEKQSSESETDPDPLDYMFFEIQNLEYMNYACPDFEEAALTPSDITTQGAKLTWPKLNVTFFDLSYKPAGGSEEDAEKVGIPAETLQADEDGNCSYTLTGLNDNTQYEVSVVGYCDEGRTMGTSALEGTFKTLEACHTPTDFKVEDITYNSATFSSTPATQESNTMLHRLIYLEDANDASHVHRFKQDDNTFEATGLHDNRSLIAKTRAVCARGDSSAWSEPITFTTPVDPSTLPDTFDIVLKVQPENAGTVSTADGKTRYIEDDEITMTATAKPGYRFVKWQDATGTQLSTNATYKWTATKEEGMESDTKTHEVEFTAVFMKQYTIALNTQPTGTTGGTVTGDGTYDEGTEVTLTATPKSTYLFVKWQKADGSTLSTDNPYTFTPTESATYTAVFRAKEYYTLDVTVVPNADWGSVSFNPQANDDDKYQEGRVVTMTATPTQYYKFKGWVNGSDTVSKELTYTVTMDGNKAYEAVFAPIQYKVTLVSNPSKDYGVIYGTSGSESDGGTYNAGSTRKLEAKPKPGYEFVKWMSGTQQLGVNPRYEFVLTQDITITAYFKEKDPLDITVNIEPEDAGTATVTGAGVTDNKVPRGGSAVLTATPAAHYAFKEWKRLDGSTINPNPYRLENVTRDYTFTAVFRALNNYTVEVETEGQGTVTGAGTYEEGSNVTLTASPDAAAHYEFKEWQDADGNQYSDQATLSFKATANVTYKAVFTEIPQYTVKVNRYLNTTQNTNVGTIEGANASGIDYYRDTEVSLKANPAKGYKFVGWQNEDGSATVSTANPYKFTLTEDVTYRAVFQENIRITVTVAPTGAGTVSGTGLFDDNDEVTLTATANNDYVFVAWKDGETVLGTNTTLEFNATASKTITAQFREKYRYNLSVTANEERGSVSLSPAADAEDGKYQEGTEVTLTANPKQYYKFLAWVNTKNNLDTLSKTNGYKVTMNRDTAVRAVFARIQYTVTLQSDPANWTWGTINGSSGNQSTGGVFDAGSQRHLEAKPRAGYEFVKWMSGDVELGTDPVYEFVLTQDITITAYFKEKDPLNINVTVQLGETANAAVGTVAVTGEGVTGNKVPRGKDAVLTATPAAHYAFQEWQFASGTKPTQNPYTITNVVRDYTVKAVFRDLETYTVTVETEGQGTVTGEGDYEEGSNVTLTATPDEHYAFTKWQDADGNTVGTDATYTFKVTGNTTVKAVFTELSKYTVTLLQYYNGVQTPAAGTLSGAGTYEDGQEVEISATAQKGYKFVKWQKPDGTQVSTANPYKFNITASTTYWAIFEANVNIAVTVAPTGAGTATGAGLYDEGDEVTLTASADADHVFVAWKDGSTELSTDNPYKFPATASKNITAQFRGKETYNLDVNWDDELGNVTFEPGSDEGEYQEGTVVTMTASPKQYCKFVGWQEKGGTIVSTELTHMVTMDRDTAGTAVFARIEYEITLQSDPADWAWGTINGTDGNQSEGGTFFAGSTRKLEAKPRAGYEFVKWMSGDVELGTDPVYEFVLTQDITITAYFKEKDPLNITVTVEPADAGTVTGAGTVVRGNSATLEATPAAHYAFQEWQFASGTKPTQNPYTITNVLRDYTVKAVFRSLNNYTVTVTNTTGGKVTDAEGATVTGENTYEEGAQVTLKAVADAHYTFTKWVIDGEDQEGSEATYTFKVTGDTTVQAVFTELPKYTVAVNSYVGTTLTPAAGTITVSGDKTADGKYYKGTEVSIEATANHGYTFVGWQLSTGGELVATNPYKFNIAANVNYRAVFKENVRIAVSVDPEGAGEVTGAGLFDAGDEVTLTATVDDDYLFVAWQDADGNTLETATTYTFTAMESKTITAKFREKEYFGISVPCISSGEEEDDLGTVSIPGGADGKWKEGSTVTMTAMPAQYCEFVEWRDKDGKVLGTDPDYSFVISQDTTFTAVFAHTQYTVTLVSNPNKTYGTINGTSGSASDGGTYNAGSTRKLEAKPKSGYEFVKWMSGDVELGTATKLEFVLTQDTTITAYFKEKAELNITVTVEPANAGKVTGAGKVQRGNNAVLTAKANAAYKFQYWENLAGDRFEDNPYMVNNVVRDYTFKAVFRAKYQYDVTVNKAPNAAAGTIARTGFLSNGKAREDTTVTLTATPAEGYTFEGWQDATGTTVSTEATLSFKVTANVTYTAVFAEIPTPQYTVTLLRDPAEGGKISGDGTYDEGTEVTIKATPNTGYTFEGWYDGTTKLDIGNPYTFTLNADVTYTAKFAAKPTVDVAVTVRLGATVDASVGTVEGAGSYEKGKTVTLKAIPASEDYLFSGWRDLDNDDELIGSANPLTFVATTNVNYAAVFREKFEVTLNILPNDNAGTVTGAGPGRQGYPRTITATPAEGYTFVGWYDEENTLVTTNASHTFILEDNVTFTAKFEVESEDEYTITLKKLPNNDAGTVSGNGRYALGEKATLKATPADNYLFVAWLKPKAEDATQYDTVSKNATYEITVEGDATYTALFRARARYTIEVDIVPNDAAGTVTGDGEYREGRTVTLKAVANEGYTFVAWVVVSQNPSPKDTVSRTATYTFSATKNATYKAVFRRTLTNYTVTLNVTPTGAGTVDGEGSYRANASVTITATPNKGYVFVGWRNQAGDYVNREATYTFNITRNTTYTAVFKKKEQYNVELTVSPAEAGTVEGEGSYLEGENVVIKATANRGYAFVEWQNEDGDMVSDKAEYRFKATTDVTYTAVFSQKALYSVSLNASPTEAGTVEGDGDYYEGENATVKATAKSGYTFVKWQDADGTMVNEAAEFTFTVESNVTYTAMFEKNVVPAKEYIVKANVLPDQNAGKVTGTGTYKEGETVTLKAEPAEGYTFVKWQDAAGKTLGTDLTYTFEATADVTYTAVFEKKAVPVKEYTIDLNVLPDRNAGKVTGAGTYKEGTPVTITATANEGYTFVKWQDAAGNTVNTAATHTFKATANVIYTAVFEKNIDPTKEYTVTLNVLPNLNAGSVKGNGVYKGGEMATITATPAPGYTFVAWMNGSDTLRKEASFSFMVTSDVTYSALFRKKENTANEQQIEAVFNVGAGNGQLYIENINDVIVKDVTVFNTVGRRLAHFTPNRRGNLTLPVNANSAVLVVRVVSEQGAGVYKVYLH